MHKNLDDPKFFHSLELTSLRQIVGCSVVASIALWILLYNVSSRTQSRRGPVTDLPPVAAKSQEVSEGHNETAAPTSISGSTAKSAWKVSPKHIAAANADFHVETEDIKTTAWVGTSVGADWPQFNGVRRDNQSDDTGLLTEWPSEGPPLAWTAHGTGAGFSSVAVVRGVVYTMGNKGESEAIMALDAGTGEKIWSTPFTSASHLPHGEGPRSTPAVHAGRVVGLGATGELVCVSAPDGSILWQKNITQYGSAVPNWGYAESVLIDRDHYRVIITPGGENATIVAFDLVNGKELWKCLLAEKDRPSSASLAVADVGGIRQYVQFTHSGTVGVRAEDGEFLWRDNSASSGVDNCSSPLVAEEFVFTASAYGKGGSLIQLVPSGDSIQSQFKYHTERMCSHHGDMVIHDGLVFGSVDPSVLTCLELKTGEVKWKNRSIGKGAVTYADGHLYLRSEQGLVALVKATGEGYIESGQFDQPNRSDVSAWSHPVVAAGRLFLRDQDTLLCYELKE